MNSGMRPRGRSPILSAVVATCVVGTIAAVLVMASRDSVRLYNRTTGVLDQAHVMRTQKRYADSESLLRTALHDSPRDGRVLNDLAWTLYLEGRYAEALPFAERAVNMRYFYAYRMDTLAHIHLALKHYPTAEAGFKRALAARPKLAESHDGLGQVYEQRGEIDKALAEYRAAVELKPGIEGTQERIRRLTDRKSR